MPESQREKLQMAVSCAETAIECVKNTTLNFNNITKVQNACTWLEEMIKMMESDLKSESI